MKDRPHLFYGAVILLVGLLYVGNSAYFRYQDLELKKRAETAAQDKVSKEAEEKSAEANKAQRDKSFNDTMLRLCLEGADEAYWSYIKLNATSTTGTKEDPIYYASEYTWDTADSRKKNEKDLCFQRYQ